MAFKVGNIQHDWRYTGGGWRWDIPRGENVTWAHLKRVGYSQKQCMSCGFIGKPDDEAPRCGEALADKLGVEYVGDE